MLNTVLVSTLTYAYLLWLCLYNFSNSGFDLKDLVAALLQKVSISKKNNQPSKTCGLHIYFDTGSSLVIWFIVEGFKLLFESRLAYYC